MSADSLTWRERYYELEQTVEQLIVGFEKVLSEGSAQTTAGVHIREVLVENEPDPVTSICCVADGSDLEYSFDFLAADTLQDSTGFSRRNSATISKSGSEMPDRCLVTVRTRKDEGFPDHESAIETIEVSLR